MDKGDGDEEIPHKDKETQKWLSLFKRTSNHGSDSFFFNLKEPPVLFQRFKSLDRAFGSVLELVLHISRVKGLP